MSRLQAWQDQFANRGLKVVGIHRPSAGETAAPPFKNLRKTLLNQKVKIPIAVDTAGKFSKAFSAPDGPYAAILGSKRRILFRQNLETTEPSRFETQLDVLLPAPGRR